VPIDKSLTNPLPAVLRPAEQVAIIKIDGVRLRRNVLIGDERGVIVEMLDTRDEYWDQPVVYAYMGTCRPHKGKGWGYHVSHEDRYTIVAGEMILALYDDRDDSPTKGVVQEFYLSREGHNQITIPRGIWHAHINPGEVDLVFVNFPSEPFVHNDPDKRTLPLDTDKIPYKFKTGLGR